MKSLLKNYLTSFLSVYFTANWGFGLIVSSGLNNYFYVSFILALILSLKPFLDAILFPLNLITLNMTGFLVYLILIYLWVLFLPQVTFSKFSFSGLNLGIINLSPFSLSGFLAIILISLTLIMFIRFFAWAFK